ncbi:MAG TPA: hypothetical protein VF147_11675, partial [Vicinamibacterales bacterium]
EASSGVFGAVAAPLGNIDKLVVIDQGAGAGGDGANSLARLAKTSPTLVFNLLQQLEALGLNVPTLLQQLGVSAAPTNGEAQVPTVTATIAPPPPRAS